MKSYVFILFLPAVLGLSACTKDGEFAGSNGAGGAGQSGGYSTQSLASAAIVVAEQAVAAAINSASAKK